MAHFGSDLGQYLAPADGGRSNDQKTTNTPKNSGTLPRPRGLLYQRPGWTVKASLITLMPLRQEHRQNNNKKGSPCGGLVSDPCCPPPPQKPVKMDPTGTQHKYKNRFINLFLPAPLLLLGVLPASVPEVGAGSRCRMRDRPIATAPRDSYLVK